MRSNESAPHVCVIGTQSNGGWIYAIGAPVRGERAAVDQQESYRVRGIGVAFVRPADDPDLDTLPCLVDNR